MIVLGVTHGQDSGAAILVDGRVVAAVNEERLNRDKLTGELPTRAAKEVLSIAGVGPWQVDEVALASDMTPLAVMRAFPDVYMRLKSRGWSYFSPFFQAAMLYQVMAHKLRVPQRIEAEASRRLMGSWLHQLRISAPVRVVEHHQAHASAAFCASGWSSALVLTIDGLGDALSVTVNRGNQGHSLRRIHEESGLAASCVYYARLTQTLGYQPVRDEGKIMGLAAYGDPAAGLGLARRALRFERGRLNRHNVFQLHSPHFGFWRRVRDLDPRVAAAAFQQNFEEQVAALVAHWVAKTGLTRVALAGGAFANVKLNQRIRQLDEVEEVYVFPHMGDGGLAYGALMAVEPAQGLDDAFLGPEYTDKSMQRALVEAGVAFTRPPDIAGAVAELLAEGRVVARFHGRMEFGPRALGHRSILVQPTDKSVNDWLNGRLGRTEFMPFAPAVLAEEFDACFERPSGGHDTARYMNMAFDCKPDFERECPGVVHVDGTARPQRVTRAQVPDLHAILTAYRALTGLPCLVNTSFNMHGEPIVCTPRQAVRTMLAGRLDALAMGPFLAVHAA